VSPERPTQALRRLVNGYQVTQAIHVAATLGIGDLLRDGPLSSDELAARASAHPRSLHRVLRALSSVGVLHEEDDGRFALTEIGDGLRSDAPEPVGGWAAYVGRPAHFRSWGALLHAVRTGENAFRSVNGADVWEYRAQHPEDGAVFDRAMTDTSRRANRELLEAYDFGRFERVIDVGGGHGAFLAAVLAANPATHGVLFDQSHVVADAGPVLEAAGVSDRCELVAGSFFDTVPPGGDAYLLKAIVHDWEDDDAVRILRNVRSAADGGAVVLVVERELGAPNENPDAKFSDLNMMVGPGGRERTRDELADLLAASGFALERVVPTGIGLNVFEGSTR
jgi:O-methyltransferase/methyltransferase family protein